MLMIFLFRSVDGAIDGYRRHFPSWPSRWEYGVIPRFGLCEQSLVEGIGSGSHVHEFGEGGVAVILEWRSTGHEHDVADDEREGLAFHFNDQLPREDFKSRVVRQGCSLDRGIRRQARDGDGPLSEVLLPGLCWRDERLDDLIE